MHATDSVCKAKLMETKSFVVIVVALKKIIFLQSCCAGIPATPGLWEIVRALPLPRSTPLSHVKVSPDQPPISHFFLMRQAL